MPAEPRRSFGAALAARRVAPTPLARDYRDGRAAVSNLELFFDLVYVFAVPQLSHTLLQDWSPAGALRAAILFFAVWWAWIYTTWVTNWLDPDKSANRIALGAVMIASLIMGCAIPTAFGGGGAVFVAAYLAVQIGRSLYASFALGEWRGSGSTNLLRIAIWFAVSGALWLAGLTTVEPAARAAWWSAALAIEYAGPFALFRVPRLGRSTPAEWIIAGNHMAERCALFIIIALGEGLLITGATYAVAPPAPGLTAAFVNAFLGSFAMWWIYFDLGARRGAEHIEHHANPGLVGRQAFTYWHIPIVAGVIVVAVADELTLAHPLEPAHAEFVLALAGGMALFVWGNMAFKRITSASGFYPLSHGVGLALTLAIAAWGFALHPPQLALAAASTLALAAIALWEWGSFHGGWVERMEARGWRLGAVLRRRIDRRRAEREARAAGRA
jgi:low temperature requirement protein LtrA